MSDRERDKRRQKKLARDKEKRRGNSRPGRDSGGRSAPAPPDPRRGFGWPVGPCWASQGWEERGATALVVFTRAADDAAVTGTFAVDLAGAGLQSVELLSVPANQVLGLAAMRSERSGFTLVEVEPSQAAAIILAAAALGGDASAATTARALIGDIDPRGAPLEVLTGPAEGPPPPPTEGWLSRWVNRLVKG